MNVDVQELEVALQATPHQDDVIELFAFDAVGAAQKRGNVPQIDIPGWVDLIIPLVKTFVARCPEAKIKNALGAVGGNRDGIQARLLRRKLTSQIRGNKLSDQEKYELVTAVVETGCKCLDDQEKWDGVYGRIHSWTPITQAQAPAQHEGEGDEEAATPPQAQQPAEGAGEPSAE